MHVEQVAEITHEALRGLLDRVGRIGLVPWAMELTSTQQGMTRVAQFVLANRNTATLEQIVAEMPPTIRGLMGAMAIPCAQVALNIALAAFDITVRHNDVLLHPGAGHSAKFAVRALAEPHSLPLVRGPARRSPLALPQREPQKAPVIAQPHAV